MATTLVETLFNSVVVCMYVMSTRTKGKSVLTPTIEQFVTKFSILANNNSLPAPWKCFNRRVDSYYSFATNEEREAARARFVMPGNETTLLFITTNAGVPNSAKYLYFDKLQAEIDAFLKTDKGQDYEISMTYEQLLLRDAKNNAIGDFEKGDLITLPISFFILLMVVGRPAFLVFFTLASAGLGGFLILTPFAKGWHEAADPHKIHRVNFASFTPSVFVCCLISLSLDYALFILVRYQEEVRKTKEDMRAVLVTFMTAGKVVLLSGSILASAFVGLAFVDFEMISSIGFGGAIRLVRCLCGRRRPHRRRRCPSLSLGISPEFLWICGRRVTAEAPLRRPRFRRRPVLRAFAPAFVPEENRSP